MKEGKTMDKTKIIYEKVMAFKQRFPGTIAWRLKAHCKVAADHINNDEEILYAFAAQKSYSMLNIVSTFVVVITDKRILLAQKRFFFGYFYYSITPDMFNDLTIKMGLIWGMAIIDTVKETVYLSNLSSGALQEIETVISKYMMQEKRQYEQEITPEERSELQNELRNMSKHGE